MASTIQELFASLPQHFDPEYSDVLAVVYQFDLNGPQGGQYHLIVEDRTCTVHQGSHADPHVTFTLSGEDCLRLLNGQLDGPSVFLSGRVQISGDLGQAMQLKLLFPSLSPPS